jgi:hypothetical protein
MDLVTHRWKYSLEKPPEAPEDQGNPEQKSHGLIEFPNPMVDQDKQEDGKQQDAQQDHPSEEQFGFSDVNRCALNKVLDRIPSDSLTHF